MWVRFGTLGCLYSGYAFKSTEYVKEGGIQVVRISDLAEDKISTKDAVYFLEKPELEPYLIKPDSFLICLTGSIGKMAWVKDLLPRYLNQRVGMFMPSSICEKSYLWHFLHTGYVLNQWIDAKTSTNGNIKNSDITDLSLPLPPLAEQKRIVAKIEELLPYIDRYEQAWSRLEAFNQRFPDDMRKSILQLAIQGKLVEQRPEEGTGDELYREIQAEKQRLIKAGKIKAEKPLPEIGENEKPFEIPESWKWVRLPDVSSSCLGKMLDKQKNVGTSSPYLRNVNVRWGAFDLMDLLEMKFEDIEAERFLIQKGDLVVCEGGEPGRCAVWQEEQPIHFQKALHRIRFYGSIFPAFFQLLFVYYSASGLLANFITGSTIKHLTGQALENLIFPLPPLAEQKRIVARLEELLAVCEKLK